MTAPPSPVRPTFVRTNFLKREAIWIAVVLVFSMIHPLTATAAMVGLLFWSLRGADQAIEALSLAVMVIFCKKLTGGDSESSVGLVKWVVILAATVRVAIEQIVRRRGGIPLPTFAAVLFAVVAGMLALVTSAMVDVSLLKLFIFLVSVFVTMGAFYLSQRREHWRNWFFTQYAVLVVASIAMMPFDMDGIAANQFRGAFGHPQAAGVYLASFTAPLVFAVFEPRLRGRLLLVLLGLAALTIGLSGARTAMLSIILGVGTTVVVALARRDLKAFFVRPRTLVTFFVCLIGGMLVLVVWSEELGGKTRKLMAKGYRGSENGDLLSIAQESVEYSRGEQIEIHLKNIRAHPYMGVGFSMVDEDGVPVSARVLGLPIKTDIEMGFLPLAILGQTGWVGTTFFVILLVSIFAPVFRRGSLEAIAVSTTVFFTNIGEATFFSPGGFGMYVWLLLAMTHVDSLRRQKGTQR